MVFKGHGLGGYMCIYIYIYIYICICICMYIVDGTYCMCPWDPYSAP